MPYNFYISTDNLHIYYESLKMRLVMEKEEKVIEVLKNEMSKMEKKIKHEIAKNIDRSYLLSHQLDKLTGNETSMNF